VTAALNQAEQDRTQATENGNGEEVEEEADEQNDEEDEEYEESEHTETPAEKKKRKRQEAVSLAKAKKSKEAQRRKSGRLGGDNPYSLGQKGDVRPGQLENCEICEKRFTVTAYSKTGPKGGLLCQKCSKERADEEKKAKPKKSGPVRKSRRQNQSNILDGIAPQGAPSLLEMCIKVSLRYSPWKELTWHVQNVADNINDIEEFGCLPETLLLRLSQILSKRRAITPRTLELFLKPDLESISIYDCGSMSALNPYPFQWSKHSICHHI
jgi:DNA repair protein RAD7